MENEIIEGFLSVTLINATNLWKKRGKQERDVFAKVIVHDIKQQNLATWKSGVIKKTLNPDWEKSDLTDDEKGFIIPIKCNGHFTLDVTVCSNDSKLASIKDVSLGNCTLILSSNSSFGKFTKDLYVYNHGAEGSITLLVDYVPCSLDDNQRDEKTSNIRKSISSKFDNMKERLRPKIDKVYHYDNIVESLNTGDVILFHGIELHSKFIESGTMSYWSHAAIIIRSPSQKIKDLYQVDSYLDIVNSAGCPIKDPVKEDVYVFESDYDTFKKEKQGGAQLIPFKSWIVDYEREVKKMFLVIRPLIFPGRTGDHSKDFPRLEPFMEECASKSYKISKIQLGASAFKLNRREDLSSVFCSELVAATLKSMDLISVNCTNITPKAFAKETYGRRLHPTHYGKDDFELDNGASLGETVRVIYNRSKYSEKVLNKLV
eukprot:TRINITY_DN9770_c0_g1_i1.p1 TRINITY_DN9770_c0_g1~~TRINITY_DN9770_c0_g1_i1.p1  ORF type:complete len:431 (+),score=71.51 TRINITY_DN9770_c0_g1_i1:53-1345(+)